MSFTHHFNRSAAEKAKRHHTAVSDVVTALAAAGMGKYVFPKPVGATPNGQYALFREIKDRMPRDVITFLIQAKGAYKYTHAYVVPAASVDLMALEEAVGTGILVSPSRTAVHVSASNEHRVMQVEHLIVPVGRS